MLPDERKYALQDPANEKKWGVRLSDALERAKKGKLFAGHTLYITSKVEPSYVRKQPLPTGVDPWIFLF